MLSPEHSTNPCKGRIHSVETYGTVDGPGVRYVVFTQGCLMRCLYCHNPDTWACEGGTLMTVEELLAGYEKKRFYYRDGGITVTGGEPMLQMEFLTTLFQEAKKRGIHTCLDTSGICFHEGDTAFMQWMDRLVKVTDLVMLDVKHMDDQVHKELTRHSNGAVFAFARYLEQHQVNMWIRHVIVEGYTTNKEELEALGYFIGGLKQVKALDVLPYHSMGKVKYEALGMEYPLQHLENLSKEKALEAKEEILKGMRRKRLELKNESFSYVQNKTS